MAMNDRFISPFSNFFADSSYNFKNQIHKFDIGLCQTTLKLICKNF